ncbi:hypothetical protein M011DRAFT_465237 [Sporormia fimetaria CBS 119925]|uniref:Alpha-1,3-mannosyltransferase n=1 Tax=Sporormia fimetaria CBS 119925 TaxID=1340428 RepID=A0A6A6VLQ2_9PLEO|nr:hypothetical protein M011DRAFT_465237 [Sporormia fimetaria CBS 119925]
MPPHLHPRSRTTTSLFTTTLAICFLVVATPHFLPCPVDPRAMADAPEDAMTGRRRRRVKEDGSEETMEEMRKRREEMRMRRECPVPKPGGLIGQVLGVKKEEGETEERESVVVSVRRARREDEK